MLDHLRFHLYNHSQLFKFWHDLPNISKSELFHYINYCLLLKQRDRNLHLSAQNRDLDQNPYENQYPSKIIFMKNHVLPEMAH